MSEVRDAYLRATFEVSKADPAKWATFIEAFKGYVLYEYERALSMAPSETQIAVGMNRRMRDLRDDFVHIEALADKLRRPPHHGSI